MGSHASDCLNKNQRIAFVPTMGALHEGHLALMRTARQHGDCVVVSIFVNPKQFNDPSDFKKYARDLDGDLKKCREVGVDCVFAPSESEIYPQHEKTKPVPLPEVAKPLEGVARPGHFQGVADVVSRLFTIVQPQSAVFGMKDYQQVRVIEEMVKEQKRNVKIIRHPTIREPDGLAMSSRNARLSSSGRKNALIIFKSLATAQSIVTTGERNRERVLQSVLNMLKSESGVKVDYVAVVDAINLKENPHQNVPWLVSIAAFVEGVRLIDNCILAPSQVKNSG